MRTQRNVTGIAVWLAFLSWMYLVAGMVSPSEVVAENKKPWYAQRVANAKIWEIRGIILEAIAANPNAVTEIVKHSITLRTDASEIILGTALQVVPEAASQITGGAVQALSEWEASKPSPTQSEPSPTQSESSPTQQMVSQQVDQNETNNQIFIGSPFDPNFGRDLTQSILELTCQGLGPVAGVVNFCTVSPSL
jgi:hypothetical protein